jgi:thymidylate kinase
MHISLEGLPALGKSELLSVLRSYFPDQARVLPELVKEVADAEGIHLFRQRARLSEAIWRAVPEREKEVRTALDAGRTVVEESHLGVHAAYAAALGDTAFLAQFQDRESDLLWPDRFLRLAAPISVSISRQAARGDPRYTVGADVLGKMLASLDAWHAHRRSDLRPLDADRPPAEVVRDLSRALGLVYAPALGAPVLSYLLLLGRPAAGKSELVQFLSNLSAEERARDYHLGRLRVADDFPLLWQKFVEDDAWEQIGRGRLHSRRSGENYAVADDHLWPFLILSLGKELVRNPARPGETVLVEFARGGPAAYRDALATLAPEVLRAGAILYLDVSFEESWRRNLARYDRARRDGILTHSVPREEMERTYATDDWAALARRDAGYIAPQGIRVPYATVPNTPEPKTDDEFAQRFRPALCTLWGLRNERT